ncbi:MAG: hypothetical protein ABSA79_07765 [Candidatus Bathyarchaeia archaeon]|jgi:hypothetical protein
MVNFDPRFTEVIYFDIECYVPPNERQQSRSSMKFNPCKKRDFVLGGVFSREFPLQNKLEPPKEIWKWKPEEERTTLLEIYDFFKASWKLIEQKTDQNPDLILIGTGISRHDIPTLYMRSLMHNIDTQEALYETYFKTKVVDLGDVGILLFRNDPRIYPMYPKTTNALMGRLGLGQKESGKGVWELYDAGQFDAIRERTMSEVEIAVKITSNLISKIVSGTF